MSKQTELAQVADTITVDSGNVGIGTSSPDVLLHVNSASSTGRIKVQGGGTSSAQLQFVAGGQTNPFVITQDASRNFIFYDNATERMRIDSSGNVGIGTSSPDTKLVIANGSDTLKSNLDSDSIDVFASGKTFNLGTTSNNVMRFFANNTEAMRLDSSGNLLVGKTAESGNTAGHFFSSTGYQRSTRNGTTQVLNRITTDGNIIDFQKDGSTAGSIGTNGGGRLHIASGDTGLDFEASTNAIRPCSGAGGGRDNVIDLGRPDVRFDDIYATNGTIQTSDRNEKQDIEVLSDAEQRVAVACKGLMRKFRWRDAVAEKGDDARIHFGIIAQDLQAAFAAEGLDAGDYAMFISSTWWEHDVEVPAVEAVAEVTETTTDEDGNEVVTVVTEAVEAVDAYTRTDTYGTQEEAPEGATERTRLGVRYNELLAFIIGAL